MPRHATGPIAQAKRIARERRLKRASQLFYRVRKSFVRYARNVATHARHRKVSGAASFYHRIPKKYSVRYR